MITHFPPNRGNKRKRGKEREREREREREGESFMWESWVIKILNSSQSESDLTITYSLTKLTLDEFDASKLWQKFDASSR